MWRSHQSFFSASRISQVNIFPLVAHLWLCLFLLFVHIQKDLRGEREKTTTTTTCIDVVEFTTMLLVFNNIDITISTSCVYYYFRTNYLASCNNGKMAAIKLIKAGGPWIPFPLWNDWYSYYQTCMSPPLGVWFGYFKLFIHAYSMLL